ncbi:MAG: SIS domain-containing protein [Sphaerochaetaceae bacterium]|jgi:D-arabinose 5-phosphate isomerase GutQ|nr:SIS domain-containing protein [Sphaerochaetaceae bacterium]
MERNVELEVLKQAFDIESAALATLKDRMDYEAMQRAVDALSSAGCIATSGCGHSGIACMHFAHLLCCIEMPARFISPSEAVHGALGFIHEHDVMVLASRGGKTAELLPILEICKKRKTTVISVTENLASPMALESDIVIPMVVTRETDRENAQGTTSFVVLSSIFDALQAALIERTGFSNKMFAVIHPGGAVGARLNASG